MERDVFTGKWPRECLAEIAYDEYGKTTNFREYVGDGSSGRPMLEWSELPPIIQRAWCAAVIATEKALNLPDRAFGPSMAVA